MFEKMLILASSSLDFESVLSSWESSGVFEYMIPLLLIFSVVFGILNKMNLFGTDRDKMINSIIAIGVALMAIQFEAVGVFFSDIFPRLGIAIACVLVFIILLGLFGEKKNQTLSSILMWSSFGVAIVVVLQSTSMFKSAGATILGIIPASWLPMIILIVLVAVIAVNSRTPREGKADSTIMQAFGKE